MTHWNYRILKKTCPNTGETIYQVHEVFYRQDGSIDSWSQQPVEPLGTSENLLRNDIRAFLSAFRLPVLVEKIQQGKSVLVRDNSRASANPSDTDYAAKASRASSYIDQLLGNHLLLKEQPALRQAYDKVDQALSDLHDIADSGLYQ